MALLFMLAVYLIAKQSKAGFLSNHKVTLELP
jgi:hypothetical protein